MPSPTTNASSPNSYRPPAHLLLLILLAPLLLCTSAASAIRVIRAPVGAPFTFSIAEGHAVDEELLPKWLRLNTTTRRQIYGIPQLRDIGHHIISIHDGHVEVEVVEEENNLCRTEGSATTWLEIIDARKLSEVTIEDQFQAVHTFLSTNLRDVEIRSSDLRVLPYNYLRRYRTVSETIHRLEEDETVDEEEEDNGDKAEIDERMTFVMNISCGELTDQASDVISAVAENGLPFRVVSGGLRNDREPIETETTTTTAVVQHTRTTRRVHNNKPIVLNPLKTFHCQRGLLCRLGIEENTFMDPEDGQTSQLALSTHAIGNHSNFLVVLPGTNQLEGVTLHSGDYNFRLEARDRAGQAASAPFQVLAKESSAREKLTHHYSLLLDVPLERFQSQPEMLRDFVYQLSGSIHRIPTHQLEAAQEKSKLAETVKEIQVHELIDNGGGQTMLRWSNATLSRKICDDRQINATRDRMMHASTERVRHEFIKAMGSRFHVRKISVEYLGSCQTRKLLSNMRVRVTTTTERNAVASGAEGSDGWAQQLLIPLILLLIIVLLCAIVALLCCMQYKRARKGAKFGDFATKGRPVVFPDEVPHREESSSANGSLATVTTPMLVEREQPPEQPPMTTVAGNAKMTMHENPLYRPPPQAQAVLKKSPIMMGAEHDAIPLGTTATSPRLGYQHRPQAQQQSPPSASRHHQAAFGSSSTFSPPGQSSLIHIDASPTPLRHSTNPFLRDHPQQQSMRGMTPVGQRLPPPYLAH